MLTQIEEARILPFSSTDMFNLVTDIAQYPQFVPYCIGSEIIKQTTNTVTAKLTFKIGLKMYSILTKNTIVAPDFIEITSLEGSFSNVEASWQFKTLNSQQSEIIFKVSYELNNFVAQLLQKQVSEVVDKVISAFSSRAFMIYDSTNLTIN